MPQLPKSTACTCNHQPSSPDNEQDNADGSPPTARGGAAQQPCQLCQQQQRSTDEKSLSSSAAGATGSEGGASAAAAANQQLAYCCLPTGCPHLNSDPISLNDLGDAVKVYCNNEACNQGVWMHGDCFREWEARILTYLRSSGRARSWSEKQRAQNLWTKKGYDLAVKACDCKCGCGHLRQDLSYQPGSAKREEDRKQRKQRKRDRVLSCSVPLQSVPSSTTNNIANNLASSAPGNGMYRGQQRTHRLSMSSTGSSSPPSSAGTTPCTPSGHFMPQNKKNKFDFFADAEQAAAGNIFRHRTDLAAFSALPRRLQNPYHIKTEDDGPHGNDETRCFLLTSLSAQRVTTVACVICQTALSVYDKYPLVDGTFFLSPLRYNSDLQVLFEHRLLYLNALCMRCMDGSGCTLKCKGCSMLWSGTTLLIGTMYSYDVFASSPCCRSRLQCKQCQQAVTGDAAVKYFSEYSRRIKCAHCAADDFHFVKSLEELYNIQKSASQAGLRL